MMRGFAGRGGGGLRGFCRSNGYRRRYVYVYAV